MIGGCFIFVSAFYFLMYGNVVGPFDNKEECEKLRSGAGVTIGECWEDRGARQVISCYPSVEYKNGAWSASDKQEEPK